MLTVMYADSNKRRFFFTEGVSSFNQMNVIYMWVTQNCVYNVIKRNPPACMGKITVPECDTA